MRELVEDGKAARLPALFELPKLVAVQDEGRNEMTTHAGVNIAIKISSSTPDYLDGSRSGKAKRSASERVWTAGDTEPYL